MKIKMVNPFGIYPPVTLEKYPFLKENNYFEYSINLTPSQIKEFGENNIVTLDFTSNKVPFKVFLTNTQIKKVEVAKKLQKKVDLKFSKTQLKKTLPYVTSLNRSLIRQWGKEQLQILKAKNIEKAKTLKNLKRQTQLFDLKAENIKKAKTLKNLKRQIQLENAKKGEVIFDKFIKNTLKKYNKPKPKKKSIFDNKSRFPKVNFCNTYRWAKVKTCFCNIK